MGELPGSNMDRNFITEELGWSVPLEGDVISLEDVKESEKSVISSTPVGKITCSKILNRGVVKSILYKA